MVVSEWRVIDRYNTLSDMEAMRTSPQPAASSQPKVFIEDDHRYSQWVNLNIGVTVIVLGRLLSILQSGRHRVNTNILDSVSIAACTPDIQVK